MAPQLDYSGTPQAAFDGMLGSLKPNQVKETAFNEEASAGLLFGRFVKWGTVSTNDSRRQGVKRLTATSEAIAGCVYHSHALEVTSADGGVIPKEAVGILRRGDMHVKCETNWTKEGSVYVRCVIAGSEEAGAVRASADSTDCIQLLSARFLNSGTAGGIAWIEFDLLADKGAQAAALLPA